MKTKIPTDVERLMWLVAESNDPSAIQDFESRFPQFSGELARRRRMVSDLKGAKSNGSMTDRIPVFIPREQKIPKPQWGTWIGAGIALAAIAFASYSATSWLNHRPLPLPAPEKVKTDPVGIPNTTVNTQADQPKQPAVVQEQPVRQDPPLIDPPKVQESLKTLKLSNTSMVAALKMIGEMAGYRVEVAPGLKDQQISIDYDQVTTSEMLKDLGARYGFTSFDQGDGSIIIVPAVDQGPPVDGPNNSSRRIG